MTDLDIVEDDVFADEPTVDESQDDGDVKGEADEVAKEEAVEPELETKEAIEPPSSEEEPKTVPIAALLDERRKAKEAREELERIKKDSLQDDENEPDPVTDPEAYKSYIREKIVAEDRTSRIEASRSLMLEKHEDYEAKEKIFLALAQQDQSLIVEMNQSHSPAEYAYNKASENYQKQYDDIKAQVLADIKNESIAKPKPKAPITPKLATASSALDLISTDDVLFSDSIF